jgi:uncharacterized iron-regulated protein
MARSIDARLRKLETPHGDLDCRTAGIYRLLKACYEVLSRLDAEPIPSDTELWAMAQVEARSGRKPNFTQALVDAWEGQHHAQP